jgi:hypothetical protein
MLIGYRRLWLLPSFLMLLTGVMKELSGAP